MMARSTGRGAALSVLAVLSLAAATLAAETTTAAAPTTTTAATAAGTPVKLGVFMESRCPDTRRFVLNQLVPAQRAMGDMFEVSFVPFGHARVLPNNRMYCQHGPRECEGNRRMACILARNKNQTSVVETFGCLLADSSPPRDCVRAHAPALDFDELERCAAGDESYKLMQEAERATGLVSYVPHLTVNGKSDHDIQDQAEHNLQAYLRKVHGESGCSADCNEAAKPQ